MEVVSVPTVNVISILLEAARSLVPDIPTAEATITAAATGQSIDTLIHFITMIQPNLIIGWFNTTLRQSVRDALMTADVTELSKIMSNPTAYAPEYSRPQLTPEEAAFIGEHFKRIYRALHELVTDSKLTPPLVFCDGQFHPNQITSSQSTSTSNSQIDTKVECTFEATELYKHLVKMNGPRVAELLPATHKSVVVTKPGGTYRYICPSKQLYTQLCSANPANPVTGEPLDQQCVEFLRSSLALELKLTLPLCTDDVCQI